MPRGGTGFNYQVSAVSYQLSAVGCWLLAVGCWLMAVIGWLMAVGCRLSADGYQVFLAALAKAAIFEGSLSPSVSTPLDTSTPHG